MAKDVIVVVQRNALPKQKESLDILLVSTTGTYPVGVYRNIASVEAVYGPKGPCPNSKIVRKATTLFNQGKTTLAASLVSKFKIVSFEPPSAKAATSAVLTIDFSGAEFETIASGQIVYVKIGGDGRAVISITAAAEINTGTKLATAFKGTTFTKGGKTYTGTATGAVVTFTANESGAADTIPGCVNIYTDEALITELPVAAQVVFTNGQNKLTAPDDLVETIKRILYFMQPESMV